MLNKQVLNFIVIGIINTVFYYLLYISFIYLGINYMFAVFLATMLGITFSFNTFRKYVFKNGNKKSIFRFLIVYLILYLTNIGLITILQVYILNYYISGLLSTLCCAVLSFLLNKFYVFSSNKD